MDPTFDEVFVFHKQNFEGDNTTRRRTPYINEEIYIGAHDQIIRGWVQVIPSVDIPNRLAIPTSDPSKPDFMPPVKGNEQYAAVYVKGHALKKVLFCPWNPDTVFYCPNTSFISQSGGFSVKDIESQPNNLSENRFFDHMIFYYFEEQTRRWISRSFKEFDQIDRNMKADPTGSSDCKLTD